MSVTIDLGLLATFVAVAEAASFSRAAKSLGTTTATVSRDVAKLEELIGSRLFHRTTRRVALTTAGATLHERAEPHVRALAHATRELPEQTPEPAGTLKLTAPYDLGATLLAPLIARFSARYPKVNVHAEFTSRRVDLAAEGFDVALRAGTTKGLGAAWRARALVKGTELGFYAAPSYLARRGAPRLLGAPDHEWLIAGPLRRMLELPKGFEPRVVANDFLFLREVARSGGGLVGLPSFIARPAVASGELVRAMPPIRVTGGQLLLVYAATKPLPRKVAAFRDFMVQSIEGEWGE